MEQELRFGPDGITEKKLGRLWATFEGSFTMFSWAFFLVIVASAITSLKGISTYKREWSIVGKEGEWSNK